MKQIDCPHCYKVNVFSGLTADCPYCDMTYGLFSSVEKLMDYCTSCKKYIKFVSCAYCRGTIVVDPTLPDEGALVCQLKTYQEKSDFHFKRAAQNSTPETNEMIKNIFGDLAHMFFGETILKTETSKTASATLKYQRALMDIDKLMRLAEFNIKRAQGTEAHLRAELLRNSIQYIAKMPDNLKFYIIDSLFGQNSQVKVLEDEIERLIKEQELRKAKMDNDDREDRYKSQKGL